MGGRRVFRFYVVIYISAYFSHPSGSQQGFGSNDLLGTLPAGVQLHSNRRRVRDFDRSRNKIL